MMNKNIKLEHIRVGGLVLAMSAAVALGGCAATGGTVNASGTSTSGGIALNVKMSSSIFLQPVAASQRVVYVEGHNTSSATNLNFGSKVDSMLESAGYRVTNDPGKAQFMLMYNVRYIGKQTKAHTIQGALAGGYGGALVGALGTGVGSRFAGDNALTGGLVGSAIGAAIGYAMRKNTYIMVVDIQLEQRNSQAVTTTSTTASNGTGNTTVSTGGQVRGWQIYRDRIGASAKGVRLAFANAEPALTHEVAHEIAGLF